MKTSDPLVLIITADTGLAGLYQRLLAESAVETRLCTDGNLALQEALDHKPGVVVLDLELAHVSSFDLLDILHKTPETAHTKVVLLGTLVSPADLKRARQLGANHVFVKSHANAAEVAAYISHLL